MCKKRKRTLSYFIISLVAHTTAAALRKIKKKNNIFSTFPGLLKYFKRKLLACDRIYTTTHCCDDDGVWVLFGIASILFHFLGEKNLGYIRNDVIATNNN